MLLLVTVEKNKWIKHADGPARARLRGGLPLPADVLMDSSRLLHTTNNVISAWVVSADSSNIDRIIAAISLSNPTDSVHHESYILFDGEIAIRLGIAINNVPGRTPDIEARAWHRDLGEMTALKYIELLAELIRNVDAETALKDALLQQIRIGKREGRYDAIPPQIAQQLGV